MYRKPDFFDTHDIDEALQLAHRVLVMNRRPATAREAVEINLPQPRDLHASGRLALREYIFTAMGKSWTQRDRSHHRPPG